MEEKIKISFVVPDYLQEDMRKQIIKDKYGLRGKSKWVSEAIEGLSKVNNYVDLIYINDVMTCFNKTESILIEKQLKKVLDELLLQVRAKHPALEGVQSRIIRTSILQRLLKS